MSNFSNLNGGRWQQGVGMVEVLITLFVVSVGLLGLAHMLGQSLRYTADSKARTQATLLASDMAECIKNNPTAAVQYAVADPGQACDPTGVQVSDELNCWHRAVGTALPGGSGRIIDEKDGRFTIEIFWNERMFALQQSQTQSQPSTGRQQSIRWTVDVM